MKRKMISLVGTLATVCLLSAPVAAEMPQHGKAHGDWTKMSSHGQDHKNKKCDMHKKSAKHGSHHGKSSLLRHKDALEMTETQISKVKSLLREAEKKTIQLKADIDISKIDQKAIIHADSVDMTKFAATVKDAAARKADIRITWMQFKVDAKAILTDEQKTKLKEIYKKKSACKTNYKH